jgi:hypothetical protein
MRKSMDARFGLHSGVNGNQGTCVSSVLNPHTGLQQFPTCIYPLPTCIVHLPSTLGICPVTTCPMHLPSTTLFKIRAFAQYQHVLCYRALGCHLCRPITTVRLLQLLACTAAVQWALLSRNCKQECPPCTSWSMHVWVGLHSGVIGNQGSCVSSVFNPHTGLQQCPTCFNLGNVGMQCPASHPVCCNDERCVQHATQCTCYGNGDCPQGTCCNGNRRASVDPPNSADSKRYWCICPVLNVLYYGALGCHPCRSMMTV